jgi:hypothetical protein
MKLVSTSDWAALLYCLMGLVSLIHATTKKPRLNLNDLSDESPDERKAATGDIKQ